MTVKPLQKAIDRYNKTGNLKPLSRELIKFILTMAGKADVGYETKFLATLPDILEALKSISVEAKNK